MRIFKNTFNTDHNSEEKIAVALILHLPAITKISHKHKPQDRTLPLKRASTKYEEELTNTAQTEYWRRRNEGK